MPDGPLPHPPSPALASAAAASDASNATDATDAALVLACRAGTAHAWARLVGRFERLIYAVPRRAGLDVDEAADVFQTVFMRLHEHLQALAQPERVQAWLVTTARRETLRRLHERRRTVSLDGGDATSAGVAELADPDPLPDELLASLQLRHLARLALQRMAEPCRSLLGLLYGGEQAPPYAEIASRMGMPVGSIGPTRARCLARLRAMLESAP